MGKIAIYPGAFKPPHKGHFNVVKQLIARDDIDKVIIAISSKERGGVELEQSLDIWNLYLTLLGGKPELVPVNGSPVYFTIKTIENNPDKEYVAVFGKEENSRFKHLDGKYDIEIYDAGNIDNLSATDFRDAIRARNIPYIKKFLPDGINYKQFMNTYVKKYNGNLDPITENETPLILPLLKSFTLYCKEFLDLSSLPPLTLNHSPNKASEMLSFGGYNPNSKSIIINVDNRHQADIFRTLAHELVHYKQDLENKLTPESGTAGHPHENEANSEAAIIMRKFAKMHPEMFIINKK